MLKGRGIFPCSANSSSPLPAKTSRCRYRYCSRIGISIRATRCHHSSSDLKISDQELNPAMSEPLRSTSPDRRRRRPALSCEQCRARKIKCDRSYPCGQCLQSRTFSCSYRPGTHPVTDMASNAFLPVQTSIGIPNPAHSIPNSSSTHVSSVGLSPSSVHLSGTTHPSSYSSPIAVPGKSHQVDTPESKILFGRIHELEAQLAVAKSEFSKSEQAATLSSPIENSTPKQLRGTVSKTRFFGPSHWMYSYVNVSYQLSAAEKLS